MTEYRDYPTDVQDAPCERCEKPVHLPHDPPCKHGVLVCDTCDIDQECNHCAAESFVLYDQAAAGAEADRIAAYDRDMRDRYARWLGEKT